MISKSSIVDNFKTIFYALIIAIIIRSLIIQPFYIPSSSMELNLLVGDRLFVTKYSYGYSKHSFPFSPPIFKDRIFENSPDRGDIVVFKTPSDNRTDFIKRLVGLPGDKIQFKDGNLFVNNEMIKKKKINKRNDIRCAGNEIDVIEYSEDLSKKKSFNIVYKSKGSMKNSDIYKVPNDHFFFLGDNRDCSSDSRFLSNVGYVHKNNLVGRARIIFFSNDTIKGSVLKFWNWGNSLRLDRFLKTIK